MDFKKLGVLVFVSQVAGGLFLHASCVKDGMNLWRLTENVSCSVGAVCEIRQDNLLQLQTIMQPGHYKLCEDLVSADELDWNIQANDVILDLGGYSVKNINIGILPDLKNVTIRNGTIKNTVIPLQVDAGTENILIENIIIDTILPGTVPANAVGLIAVGDVTGITVRNITIYNGAPRNIKFFDFNGPYTDVVFENIVCIGTNVDFVDVPANPSAVIDLRSCNTLTMRNISLIDQWQELNGIRINNSDALNIDGVSIVSLPGSPISFTTAYEVSDSTSGLHKNIRIDGGSDFIFFSGIITTNSTNMIFDTCYVENISDTGIDLAGSNQITHTTVTQCGGVGINLSGASSIARNCAVTNNDSFGYIVSASCQLIDCLASFTGTSGFFTEANNVLFERCTSTFNTDAGFQIFGNGCSLHACTANNNNSGFEVAVTNGCFITDSIANDNATYGFLMSNINAEAVFSALNTPTNGTWNIGQISPTIGTTNNRNVRLVNNTALRNASGGFAMNGTVYDKNNVFGSTAFSATPIFPPIGVVNTLQGAIYNDPKPLNNTSLGATTGIVGRYANAVGGNLVNDIPASDI